MSDRTEQAVDSASAGAQKGRRLRWIVAGVVVIAVALVAWARMGALGLPSPPTGTTLESAGLGDLELAGRLDAYVRGGASTESVFGGAMAANTAGLGKELRRAAELVREGLAAALAGDEPGGLARMQEGLRLAPDNLVLGNAYRMTVFDLKRRHLSRAYQEGLLTPAMPPHLANEPIGFFTELDREHNTRETKLHLAFAWVDHMLLNPALEIKAPSSVEAVKILTGVIDDGNAPYVPALFARGMNHLHRPSRLVWPEAKNTPLDAAARDIGLCVAIGRKLGVGSKRLQATLALALGDAYVKADRLGVARSWWQIAQNLSREQSMHEAVERRYGWHDEEALDRLEEELDRARSELEHPMTDLAMMWR